MAPCVPTGINTGVFILPRAVSNTPARAFPVEASKVNGKAFILPPSAVGVEHPEAFASDLDNWHSHFNICRGKDTGSDTFVTKRECINSGGQWNDAIGWMLHAWVVPNHDSQLGVFSMWNPSIAPMGNKDTIASDRLIQGSDFPEGAQQSLITNFAFDPIIEVEVGQSVFFNNSDSVPHTVSAGTPDAPDLRSCLLYTSPSPRDVEESRMPSSA